MSRSAELENIRKKIKLLWFVKFYYFNDDVVIMLNNLMMACQGNYFVEHVLTC